MVALAEFTEWTPEKFGELAGGSVVLLLLLAGVLKCVQVMRRPTTSKLCLLSLLLLLSGWLVTSFGNLLSIILAIKGEPFSGLFAFGGILLVLAGLILGIVGLATFDHVRHRQGKAQAIWAISLGSLVFVGLMGGVAFGAMRKFRELRDVRVAERETNVGKPIEKADLNFSIAPPAGWSEMKPEAVNKLACVVIRRRNPEVFGLVIAERVPGVTLEQLRELAKSNLATGAEVISQTEETVELNGLTFAHINSRARTSAPALTLEYEHWLATRGGFSWQVVFWTTGDREELTKASRPVAESFRMLDPEMDATGGGTIVDVDRPTLGYRTRIAGMGWLQSTISDGSKLVDFRARRANEALLVLPLRFGGGEPPDLDALRRGLLSAMNFEKPPDDDFTVKPWKPGHGGTGLELETERAADGKRFHYILRIARGKNSAHLVAGWAAVPGGNRDLVRRALDAIELTEPHGPPPTLDAELEEALGLLLNQAALSLFNRNDFKNSALWFTKAFRHGGDPVMLANAGDAYERLDQPAKGRDLLAPEMKRFSKNTYLGNRYARLQVLAGDVEQGGETFLKLIENGLTDEDDLLSWLQLLNERGQHDIALRCADAWVARQPSIDSRRWQAQTYSASGDSAKAIALLEKLHEDEPESAKAAIALGNCYNDAGEHAKAAALAEALLAKNADSPAALTLLGWSQMGRKWYRDAKASFERAARKNPNDDDLRDAIRQASAALGQGDNSDVKEPIDPVAIPAEVAAALARHAPPADFGKGFSSAWLLRATGYRFEKGKPMRRTIHRRAKILTTEAVGEFSSVEASFDPVNERIFMNRLEVRDAEGKSIAQASLGDAYVRDPDDTTASHKKVLHMQVAGVRPGTTVEWEVTIEDRFTSDEFPFERHLLASGLPLAADTVFVTGDIGAVRAEVAQDKQMTKIRGDRLLAWMVTDQPAAVSEPFSVAAERRLPMLRLGGDEGPWEKVGKDYLKQIEDRLKPDDAIAGLAANLINGKSGEREKIAAIARHVQKEIAYKAIEFGIRARRPNAPAETLRLRYGDCKDTALLVHLLLRAAGIESHLALVNTNWTIEPALPTLDQFNHVVVMVPALGKNRLLDATDKTLALDAFPAGYLWHSHALVLDPMRPRLIETAAAPSPEECRVSSRRTVTVRDNDWHVEETLELTGYYASWFRDAFIGLSPDSQRDKAQGILAGEGAARLHEFNFKNLDEIGEPARISFSYDVRNGVATNGGRQSGSLPALWERDYLATRFVKDRRNPFEIDYPLHLTSEVVVKLPATPERESLAALAQQARTRPATWSLKGETRDGKLVVNFDFQAASGTSPASAYAAFHDAWDSARRAWDKPLAWKIP